MGYHELLFYKRIVLEHIRNYDYDYYNNAINILADTIYELYGSTMFYDDVLEMLNKFEQEIESAGV